MLLIKKIIHSIFADKNLANLVNINLLRPISVLDIGARGGLGWPWNSAKSDTINSILVEPDPIEVQRLSRNNQTVLPYALCLMA